MFETEIQDFGTGVCRGDFADSKTRALYNFKIIGGDRFKDFLKTFKNFEFILASLKLENFTKTKKLRNRILY